MGGTLDVRDQQLGAGRQRGRDSVNGAVPVGRVLFGHMPPGNGLAVPLQVRPEPGVQRQIGQLAVVFKRVDHAQPRPLHGAAGNVFGGGQRQLARWLHVQRHHRGNESLVGPGGHTNAHLAPGIFQCRKLRLQAAQQRTLAGRAQHPRLRAGAQTLHQRHPVRRAGLACPQHPGQLRQPRQRVGRPHTGALRHQRGPGLGPLNQGDGRVSHHV
jgi:hypothetical protein